MTTEFTKEQLATWADKLIEETRSDISISRTDAHAESFRAQLALLEIARTALKDAPESGDVILHMGQAMAVFEALKSEKLSERVTDAELGSMGATNIQVWSSKTGGEIHYAVSNGGCTLTIKPVAVPVGQPVMFIDGDISPADAEKLATIIREWDNEPVADVVAWSHPQHPKQTCNIRWRRFDVAPGPLFTAPPATANETRQIRDLVMMVKVLARTVRKYKAGSQQAKDFLAYLERECLVSSTDCLRIDAKDPG